MFPSPTAKRKAYKEKVAEDSEFRRNVSRQGSKVSKTSLHRVWQRRVSFVAVKNQTLSGASTRTRSVNRRKKKEIKAQKGRRKKKKRKKGYKGLAHKHQTGKDVRGI